MKLEERINALTKLGAILNNVGENKELEDVYSLGITNSEYAELNELVERVSVYNPWFTASEVRKSLKAWGQILREETLKKWIGNYAFENINADKTVSIIMAGNIPMVGFHDFLSVYVTGMAMKIKLSSDDNKLLPKIFEILSLFDDALFSRVEIVQGPMKDFDAVIATGSNNTARHFEQYFGKYPNIIRKNRTSIAILSGKETESDLNKLAEDVFAYYGLGCRNVTKVYLPAGYDLNKLFKAFYAYNYVVNNNKYANNYDYYKAIFLMEQHNILENGFLLMKEDESIHSPIGTLYYEYYEDPQLLKEKLSLLKEEIQCVVAEDTVPFGKAQSPELWDYADNVDTLKFLLEL